MVVIAIIMILASFLFGVNGRPYGANAQNVSQQVTATLNLAKMRAVSTRRQHLVTVEPHKISMWQAPSTGFAAVTDPTTWVFVQQITLPNTITIWDVSSTIFATAGATVTQNTSLSAALTFKPDGSSTGGTIFITDSAHAKEYRVVIYRVTGSAYARQTW
jgi:Tfp pilus assembly protein FimT